MAGAEFSGDCGKARRQLLDRDLANRLVQFLDQPSAVDQPRPAETHIEIAEHASACERAAPFLGTVELSRRETAADDRADGGAGDDVRREALGDQRAEDAD